jgi:hypothetical protein
VKQIEQEEDEGVGIAAIRGRLHQAERTRTIGADAAKLAVKVSLLGIERGYDRRNRRILMCPTQAPAGQQPDCAAIQPGMHPVPVELDFVQPCGPFRRLVDQFGELRFDPVRRRSRRGASATRERTRHVSSMNSVEVRLARSPRPLPASQNLHKSRRSPRPPTAAIDPKASSCGSEQIGRLCPKRICSRSNGCQLILSGVLPIMVVLDRSELDRPARSQPPQAWLLRPLPAGNLEVEWVPLTLL